MSAEKTHVENIAQIVSRKRRMADKLEAAIQEYGGRDVFYRSMIETFRKEADEIEAAHKSEVDKLNSVIQATVSRSDAEIDRLRREIAELVNNRDDLRSAVQLGLSLLDLGNGVPYKTVSKKDIEYMKASIAKLPKESEVAK